MDQVVEKLKYTQEINALEQGIFQDPFAFLGPHQVTKNTYQLKVFLPGATAVSYVGKQSILFEQVEKSALFILTLSAKQFQTDYKLHIDYPLQSVIEEDVYRFGSTIDEQAMYLFNEGSLEQAYRHLGAHWRSVEGIDGVRFTVWAPNAQSVSVIGDFNHWQNNRHFMRKHPASGVWEIFIPHLTEGTHYKFSLLTAQGERLEKADPFAFAMQHPPATASIIAAKNIFDTQKTNEALKRETAKKIQRNAIDAPISIYEVHAGSWKRVPDEQNRYLSYQELADQLVPYVKGLGFTHIQLMPISEFPFDGSWGYQPVGLFAPSSRFGTLADFQHLVDACHAANIGLLIDWVPGHFPSDAHGLAKFDGSHLFEHADKRQGYHPDWHTHIYNYDRAEVQTFLLANAMYWFDQFAIDGLRVDAVASMLYLDYSRKEGEWVANQHGGRENLGAIELLRQVNQRCYQRHPGIMMVAEESTAWPGVTQFTEHGGLGFGYKWNMGWMNDSLHYMQRDPLYRQHHHNEMTFSLVYAFSENYILPLSHDEVVHGKGSLINKMPGDDWQKFANLRAFFGFMWAHPGKKLLFMGGEFAQYREWDHNHSLDWHLLEHAPHQGMQALITKLNNVYCSTPALYEKDNHPSGFTWIDGHNSEQSIFSFMRFGKLATDVVLILSNMTPNSYQTFRVGVPHQGLYRVILDTDATEFGGSGFAKTTRYKSEDEPWQGQAFSIEIALPPLASIYLVKDGA
ncbi:1,4-alpha-glucan branching protein GlgB [Pseudoalteromonas tunicata]|jgi:1,4-alpha-glucan branching enzyme|uniref:1,4-alpha-glucan branching enzyme GlgB n=1 Tax=Pseudoalteromonas tunicata D2 TaxID=87626 RepID=A4C4C9_9GAMM|nr:1,4-alpha-glucan branching protein GlgB [Pseudoalteromonas tunicata]ATC97106.1 1,4-alpha-glucan branching enzyme [Pseudoalteromonas tunicata]AXT33215.1 1,4-alpha-glucan branching protein GlgB [Pseudoalteromonas tunicata]EAR30411.1 glycogen branching enzyme [Pseudoalteromonas tunicata D2]